MENGDEGENVRAEMEKEKRQAYSCVFGWAENLTHRLTQPEFDAESDG
jgi:hypothetical protein